MVPSSFMISQITAEGVHPAKQPGHSPLQYAQHASTPTIDRLQGKMCAWLHQITGLSLGRNRCLHRAGTVCRTDAGGDYLQPLQSTP